MAWNLAPVLQMGKKISEKYYPCLYLSIDQAWWVNKLWFKRYLQKCTLYSLKCTPNTNRVLIIICDVTDLVNHGMVKNAKT